MGEDVRKYNERLHNEHHSGRTGEQRALQNHSKIYAMIQESEMMVLPGIKTTLPELEGFRTLLSHDRDPPRVRASS